MATQQRREDLTVLEQTIPKLSKGVKVKASVRNGVLKAACIRVILRASEDGISSLDKGVEGIIEKCMISIMDASFPDHEKGLRSIWALVRLGDLLEACPEDALALIEGVEDELNQMRGIPDLEKLESGRLDLEENLGETITPECCTSREKEEEEKEEDTFIRLHKEGGIAEVRLGKNPEGITTGEDMIITIKDLGLGYLKIVVKEMHGDLEIKDRAMVNLAETLVRSIINQKLEPQEIPDGDDKFLDQVRQKVSRSLDPELACLIEKQVNGAEPGEILKTACVQILAYMDHGNQDKRLEIQRCIHENILSMVLANPSPVQEKHFLSLIHALFSLEKCLELDPDRVISLVKQADTQVRDMI